MSYYRTIDCVNRLLEDMHLPTYEYREYADSMVLLAIVEQLHKGVLELEDKMDGVLK